MFSVNQVKSTTWQAGWVHYTPCGWRCGAHPSVKHGVNKPRMWCPVPACGEQTSPSLHVTARSWSTPVPHNCLHLRQSSNCVLLDFGCAGLDRSFLLSVPPCLCFNTWLCLFFPPSVLSGKELQGHSNIYVTPNCAGKRQLKVDPKPCNCAASERDSSSESASWKHSWWVQICFHWWRGTSRAIVALSELRGNQSDFCPALGQINRQGIGNKAPRIFMYAKEVCQECGHGRWPLYISK